LAWSTARSSEQSGGLADAVLEQGHADHQHLCVDAVGVEPVDQRAGRRKIEAQRHAVARQPHHGVGLLGRPDASIDVFP
jgi:hypothetical protein